LNQANRITAALMRSSGVAPIGVEGDKVIIEVPSEWPDELKRRIEKPDHRSLVEQCISQVIGVSAGLRFVVQGEYRPRPQPATPTPSEAGESPKDDQPDQETEPDSASSEPTKTSVEPDPEEDPMLQEALNLGAKIKNVE
jgi:hypothetical protein